MSMIFQFCSKIFFKTIPLNHLIIILSRYKARSELLILKKLDSNVYSDFVFNCRMGVIRVIELPI